MSNSKTTLITLLILATVIPLAEATVLGVSPATLEFKNTTRGGYYTKYLTASTTDKNLICKVTTSGEISRWVSIEDDSFNLSGQYKFPLRVAIPESTPNGVYKGYIQVTVGATNTILGGTGMGVQPSIFIPTTIEVTGTEATWLKVLRVQASSAIEGDPIQAEVTLKNNAALQLNPITTLEVMGYDRKTVYASERIINDTIAPQAKKTLNIKIPSEGMKPGLYFLHIRVQSDDKEYWDSKESFYILSTDNPIEHPINVEAALEEASVSSTNVTLGDAITIKAKYSNVGDVPIETKLKAEFIKLGAPIYSQESESAYLESNQTKIVSLLYKPTEQGDYNVRMWVEYSGVRTAVMETKIQVWNYTPPLISPDLNMQIIIPFLLILAVAWLLMYYREYYVMD